MNASIQRSSVNISWLWIVSKIAPSRNRTKLMHSLTTSYNILPIRFHMCNLTGVICFPVTAGFRSELLTAQKWFSRFPYSHRSLTITGSLCLSAEKLLSSSMHFWYTAIIYLIFLRCQAGCYDLLRKLFFLAFPTFISYNYFKTDMCTDLTGRGREFYGKYAKYAEKKRR